MRRTTRQRSGPTAPQAVSPTREELERRLKDAVAVEYIDKLPAFISVAELSLYSGIKSSELAAAAFEGILHVSKRDGILGVVVSENVEFLKRVPLLQLPLPATEEPLPELTNLEVSSVARELIIRQSDAESVPPFVVIDRLLGIG